MWSNIFCYFSLFLVIILLREVSSVIQGSADDTNFSQRKNRYVLKVTDRSIQGKLNSMLNNITFGKSKLFSYHPSSNQIASRPGNRKKKSEPKHHYEFFGEDQCPMNKCSPRKESK